MTSIEEKLDKIKKSKLLATTNIDRADLITHNGTFHADEVFSTVLLARILGKDEIQICRTSNIKENVKGIVYDAGFGKFDHHQVGGNGERENGIKYASFGLVWKEYGKKYLKTLDIKEVEEIWSMIDKKLVQNIDAVDNGQVGKLVQSDLEIVTLPSLISMFNSNWDDEKENQDENFLKSVQFASIIFNRFIISAVSKINAKVGVNEAIEKSENQILILEKFMPWKEFLLNSENEKAKDILFAIFPSNRGGYSVNTVPKEKGSFESRKLLPEKWAGLKDEELQKVSKVETAIFCHMGRFICSAKTKEDAIKMAKIAIETEK